jgi:hypothetical protein
MKIKGTVTNRNEQAEGHSQVRISCTMDLGDGVERPVEVILSTPDLAILDAFKRKETVSFVRE